MPLDIYLTRVTAPRTSITFAGTEARRESKSGRLILRRAAQPLLWRKLVNSQFSIVTIGVLNLPHRPALSTSLAAQKLRNALPTALGVSYHGPTVLASTSKSNKPDDYKALQQRTKRYRH